MRFFNTSGPVVAADHYLVPPLDRLDFDEFRGLVRDKRYFVMHAPRQSGKTSVLLAARELLGREGYSCVYASFEVARALEDNGQAVRAVLAQLGSRALRLGDDFVDGAWPDLLDKYGPETALGELLSRWAAATPRPLVLLIDEIDALADQALLAVLAQLRAGYDERPDRFPHSIVLCGLRDVRDYRIDPHASPFNISAKSLRLGDFSKRQVASLLGQHTEGTGQGFAQEAVDSVWKARPRASRARPSVTARARSQQRKSARPESRSSFAERRTWTSWRTVSARVGYAAWSSRSSAAERIRRSPAATWSTHATLAWSPRTNRCASPIRSTPK